METLVLKELSEKERLTLAYLGRSSRQQGSDSGNQHFA